jgi:hypothetical protein
MYWQDVIRFEALRQVGLDSLEQVVAEEEAVQRVLHTTTHLNQILQHRPRRRRLRPDKHCPNRHKEIQSRHNVA